MVRGGSKAFHTPLPTSAPLDEEERVEESVGPRRWTAPLAVGIVLVCGFLSLSTEGCEFKTHTTTTTYTTTTTSTTTTTTTTTIFVATPEAPPGMSLPPVPPYSEQCLGFKICPEFPLPYLDEYPTSYSYSGSFPEGFVWGMGTAAYQIEGAYREGGRGASIWDTFSGANTVGMPGGDCSYCCKQAPCPTSDVMVARGATGNVATDSYHLWRTDIALMKSMGLKNYRFSIAWPRMFPTGVASGAPNPEAVKFYNDFINALIAAGITPYVTLYHWDLPQALLSPPEVGGWWARDNETGQPVGQILPNWLHYADTCFSLFGDRVKTWITFNEAWTFTFLASGYGIAPSIEPFRNMTIDPWIAGHNVLNAHAAAYHLYKNKYAGKQKGHIGITNNVDWREPKTTHPADIAAAARAVTFGLGWFADPIFGGFGDYPPEMRALYGDRLPKFTEDESAALNGSADFFGLNHYGTGWYEYSTQPMADTSYSKGSETGFEHGQSAWLYGSGWGFRKLLNWISKRYNRPKIYVTEGGWSVAANNWSEGVADADRVYYYANYTSELLKAIHEDNVDVRGYFAWSLMDNFEWAHGYVERFGTDFNDYKFGFDPNAPVDNMSQPTPWHQKRYRKESNCWLEAVWSKNKLSDPSGEPFCAQALEVVGKYVPDTGSPYQYCQLSITLGSDGERGEIVSIGEECKLTNSTSAKIRGSTVVADFSPFGGPPDFQGFFEAGARQGIHWDDGTHWTKLGKVGLSVRKA